MTTGPVPLECFPVFPLSREPFVSRRVSFALEVDVIESSPLLFSPGEYIAAPNVMDTGSVERNDIQIAQPTYALFPSEDPFDVSDRLSTPRFIIYLLHRDLLGKPGNISWLAGPTSLHDVLPEFPGRYPLESPGYEVDLLGLSLTIFPQGIQWNAVFHLLWCHRTILMGMQDCWHRYLGLHQLAQCCGRQCRQTSPFTVLSTVHLNYLRPGLTTVFRVGVLLGRARYCRSFLIQALGALTVDVPSATLHTSLQISLNPPGSMGYRCTTPSF